METKSFSQRDEEPHILKYFDAHPDAEKWFLDIGAADGKTFSNTHALALRGWKGICVEPSPYGLVGLLKTYADNPNIHIISAALADVAEPETVVLHVTPDLISTTDGKHALAHTRKWEVEGAKFGLMSVMGMSWRDIVDNVGIYRFGMINLDVEGNNVPLLKTMPPELMDNCQLLCVEFDGKADEIVKFCTPHGLKLIHKTAENVLLAKI